MGKLASVGGEDANVREAGRKRPRPQNKCVWASVKKDPGEVIGEMVAKALRRDPRKRKRWVVRLDDSERQYSLVHDILRSVGVECTIVLDIIHVLESLWKASRAFFGEASVEGERWGTERLLNILRGKVVHVAAGIRRSATLRGLTGQDRQRVDGCADYLLDNAALMRYGEYLADGLPIATGVIEGVRRHLVKDRTEPTGARLGLEGAEAVLRLRALRASGDFEAHWRFHEAREYERNHASRYAANDPPASQCPFTNPRRRHLCLVEWPPASHANRRRRRAAPKSACTHEAVRSIPGGNGYLVPAGRPAVAAASVRPRLASTAAGLGGPATTGGSSALLVPPHSATRALIPPPSITSPVCWSAKSPR